MINDFKIEILRIVEKNDGKFSWYQLDRQLSYNGIAMSENLMQAIHDLEFEGFIATKEGDNPSQPLYSLTPQGKAFITNSNA
jgi:DNA-binding PadR family transcriptional regulator